MDNLVSGTWKSGHAIEIPQLNEGFGVLARTVGSRRSTRDSLDGDTWLD